MDSEQPASAAIRFTLVAVRYFENRTSKLDSLLSKDSGVERVLDFGHFGDEIGLVNHLLHGVIYVSSGQDQVQMGLVAPHSANFVYHGINVKKPIAQDV